MKPSTAQIEAGNYPKEHVTAHGMRVSIENAKGSTRSGVSKTGKRWANRMEHDYGYIRGTSGRDGDHIDVFLGPHHEDPSVPVHVVDQVDPDTGAFDEHKVMLGFKTPDEAIDAYHANYEDGWQGMKAVTPLSMDRFKEWAFADGTRMKPVSEHSVSEEDIRRFAGGGFVGYKSAGKRPEAHNDRASAADMPVQALRGWAAGTAGLPGDIESLTRQFIRMLGAEGSPAASVDEHTTLPTSDFYKEWLPLAPKGASSKAAMELGSLMGGVGAGTAAKGVAKAGKFAAKGAAEQIAKGIEGQGALGRVLAPAQPMYAVKPKGGNWLPDRIDTYIDSTVNDPGAWRDYAPGGEPPARRPEQEWLSKNLRKYIRNEMGTASDPLLKLEKEGRLHIAPEALLERSRAHGVSARPTAEAMFPVRPSHLPDAPSKFHIDTTGRNYRTPWENLTDAQLFSQDLPDALDEITRTGWSIPDEVPKSVEDFKNKLFEAGYETEDLADIDGKYGWLDKIDPKSKIYDLVNPHEDNLGFEHVRDYINQALTASDVERAWQTNPALRDLPGQETARGLIARGLHLTPDALQRSSFADIVAKTGEWDRLLASQKPLVDLNKGIKKVHKTYDSGHQWVELDPEGLAGEGSAMGHCVGGYCSSVEDGSTRILSLRGKDGKPVTTVEVARGPNSFLTNSGTLSAAGGAKIRKDFPGVLDEYQDAFTKSGKHTMHYAQDLPDWLRMNKPDVYAATVEAKPNYLVRQIKGRFNLKPPEDAMPHIQDLVRNGLGEDLQNWEAVYDLQNSGLVRQGDKYLTPQEISDLMPKVDLPGEGLKPFAEGGSAGDYSDSSSPADPGGSVNDGGITNTPGYADRQGVTGANTESSTNVGSSSFGLGEGLSFDNMLADLAAEQAAAGITNTPGYAQRQGVAGANTGQSTNPNSSSGGTGPGINTEARFSSTPLGGVFGFLGNLGLNAATGGAYGMANSLTGAATGQSLTSRALDALTAAFDSPTPAPDAESAQNPGPGMPDRSVNDSGDLNYAINPVNNAGALSGLYAQNTVNTGTPAWADPLAIGNRQLRVYDPVFTPGNPTV